MLSRGNRFGQHALYIKHFLSEKMKASGCFPAWHPAAVIPLTVTVVGIEVVVRTNSTVPPVMPFVNSCFDLTRNPNPTRNPAPPQ